MYRPLIDIQKELCYDSFMGIGKRSDGSFYIRCDWDDCDHKEDLEAKTFYEASAEARRKGWRLAKDNEGRWVNFCHEFCQTCYFAPQVTVRLKKHSR